MNRILYVGLNPANYKTDGELTHLPLIEIVPRPKNDPDIECTLAAFPLYTHLIITSKSTLQILKEYVSLAEWKTKVTIAIGQITAQHLEDSGIHPALVAQDETAEGLVAALKNIDLSRAFVLWPHAALSRPLIANYLYEQFIPYAECILYDTKFIEPAHLPNLKQFNEIVFTSPSTVDAFIKAYDTLPTNKKLTPIGPVTGSHLQSLLL